MRTIRGKPKETPMHAWYLGGIDHRPFLHLFEMSDSALAVLGIQRRWPAPTADIPAGSA
jgi:hypothetical protein